MKKVLLCIGILLFLVTGIQAQPPGGPGWVQITNNVVFPASSTVAYGSTIVKAAFSSAAATMGTVASIPACAVPPPATTQYYIGTAVASFGITGRKAYGIYVMFEGLNSGENIIPRVNGFGAYDLTPANFLPAVGGSYTGCAPCGASGPCTLAGTPGSIYGPTTAGVIGPCNGGAFDIEECTGISSFNIEVDGGSVSGITFSIYMDTIRPKQCSDAHNNSPCEGDSLKLTDTNSLATPTSTYYWYGPHGFTSTDKNPFKYPALLTDSGLYTCVINAGITGVLNDTDTTVVDVHPRAYISTIFDNTPLCANPLDVLQLRMTGPAIPGETWSWTGPGLFTSTLASPDIFAFSASDTGFYVLVTTTPYGCGDIDSVYAFLKPAPPPPSISDPTPYCWGYPFVPFTVGTATGNTTEWYTKHGGTASAIAPVINTFISGSTKVYVSQRDGLCESDLDSMTVVVLPHMDSNFTWNVALGCDSDIVTLTNNTTNYVWSQWTFDDGSGSADTTHTQHAFSRHGVHKVTVVSKNSSGCPVTDIGYVNTTHYIAPKFSLSPDQICAGIMTINNDSFTTIIDSTIVAQPDGYLKGLNGTSAKVDTLNNLTDTLTPKYLAASYLWSWGDGTEDATNTRKPAHHSYNTGGIYPVTLTVTDSLGCVDTLTKPLYVLKLNLNNFHDTTLCVSQPLPLVPTLQRLGNPAWSSGYPDIFSWSPNMYLSDTTSPTPFYTYDQEALTTYTITATDAVLGCYSVDTMRIHSVRGIILANVTNSSYIYYGNSIQLNADSEVLYTWRPDDGTLNNANINNPIATPLVTTTYIVYGYDFHGCLDSAYVTVHVDSTMNESVPSAFTPNGDGLNDVFRPVGIKFQSAVDFRVYNRLGQQVFYSNNYMNGWDGKYNGEPQDIGTYFYVITVARPGGDGENVTYKGTVTLIR